MFKFGATVGRGGEGTANQNAPRVSSTFQTEQLLPLERLNNTKLNGTLAFSFPAFSNSCDLNLGNFSRKKKNFVDNMTCYFLVVVYVRLRHSIR